MKDVPSQSFDATQNTSTSSRATPTRKRVRDLGICCMPQCSAEADITCLNCEMYFCDGHSASGFCHFCLPDAQVKAACEATPSTAAAVAEATPVVVHSLAQHTQIGGGLTRPRYAGNDGTSTGTAGNGLEEGNDQDPLRLWAPRILRPLTRPPWQRSTRSPVAVPTQVKGRPKGRGKLHGSISNFMMPQGRGRGAKGALPLGQPCAVPYCGNTAVYVCFNCSYPFCGSCCTADAYGPEDDEKRWCWQCMALVRGRMPPPNARGPWYSAGAPRSP